MRMNKYWVAGASAALVMVSSPAVAATLSNGSGQSCGDAIGVWHFVNNQTGGAGAGTLTATFTDGTVWTVGASKVLSSTNDATRTGEMWRVLKRCCGTVSYRGVTASCLEHGSVR